MGEMPDGGVPLLAPVDCGFGCGERVARADPAGFVALVARALAAVFSAPLLAFRERVVVVAPVEAAALFLVVDDLAVRVFLPVAGLVVAADVLRLRGLRAGVDSSEPRRSSEPSRFSTGSCRRRAAKTEAAAAPMASAKRPVAVGL